MPSGPGSFGWDATGDNDTGESAADGVWDTKDLGGLPAMGGWAKFGKTSGTPSSSTLSGAFTDGLIPEPPVLAGFEWAALWGFAIGCPALIKRPSFPDLLEALGGEVALG